MDDWCIDGLTQEPEVVWNFRRNAVEVEIIDWRTSAVQPALDDAGYQKISVPVVEDEAALFARNAEALELYSAELRSRMLPLTGASDVVFFDATVRSEGTDASRAEGVQPANLRVHVDQSPRSALARAKAHGGVHRRFKRFQVVNAWKPLMGSVRNYALAFCDYRSLDPARDLVSTRLKISIMAARQGKLLAHCERCSQMGILGSSNTE